MARSWLLQIGGPGFVAPVARKEGVGSVGLGELVEVLQPLVGT